MGTIRDGENILGEVFEHTNFGTCSTLASEQIKEVYCPLYRNYIGARISIKFTHGNTAGTCAGTDHNVIDPIQAPKIKIGDKVVYPIYVGGEPAGEGFINAGDVHDFVFDGEHFCDITADVIYKGGNDEIWYYEKARNGKIEQSLTKSTSGETRTIEFPIYIEKINQLSVFLPLGAGSNLFLPREQTYNGRTYTYKFHGQSGVFTGSISFKHYATGE